MFMSACLAAFLSYLALGNIESPEGIFGCVLVCALPYHICCTLTHTLTPSHPHTLTQCYPDKAIRRQVQKLEVLCRYSPEGCEWRGELNLWEVRRILKCHPQQS